MRMAHQEAQAPRRLWHSLFKPGKGVGHGSSHGEKRAQPTWNLGILNDRETIEVPGSVLLLAQGRNEPLGLRNAPARTSHSSLATGYFPEPSTPPPGPGEEEKKKTKDGQIILDPQPDDSHNDPLNWPAWRRDSALLSLGLYCMVGGGITPIIAAGFTDIADDYQINVADVSLTTGLYMMGLGIGSVIFSPTAILYGKRPVYLFSAIIFILSAVWCALSPTYTSLLLARIFQGIAVSPVECLPSATIAEIFFLHERAYRIGVYTLLLLGGKNLIPLVSAAVIQSLGWRWVFWIVAIVVAFCGFLLFLFVPETFWDRSPVPKSRQHPKRPGLFNRISSARQSVHTPSHITNGGGVTAATEKLDPDEARIKSTVDQDEATKPQNQTRTKKAHVGFAPDVDKEATLGSENESDGTDSKSPKGTSAAGGNDDPPTAGASALDSESPSQPENAIVPNRPDVSRSQSIRSILTPGNPGIPGRVVPPTPDMHSFNSPYYRGLDATDYFNSPEARRNQHNTNALNSDVESEKVPISNLAAVTKGQTYTHALRQAPPKSFVQQLRIHHGRLNHDRWWKAAIRPLILFSYPSVLWSAAIYSCSIGWLIVISESVAIIFREGTYQFSALATGLVYISPFIGGVLGTAVAGKVSDIIVKAMARRNGGLYEPEFRLVMAAPVAITTVIGLMGFGWSASVNDAWIVPTVFFGIVSFGCSLGSTTAITFCVDSYRQYAGEALVTLNFSKNIFHGLVFSLFVTEWLTHDGSKTVYIWIGIIQLIVLLFTIPMYIYGKRARMWTVRMNFMEKY
ncbi:major facilitator superfamily domain-containing protein [Biscogniauxia sp. FL1348]|nr:major facilitator superfamily domain-containing protein [Biscogniauxia sp. FL1348]